MSGLPIPTVVPVLAWTALSSDVLTPFQGTVNGTVIQSGLSPIQLRNSAFYMTYVLNMLTPVAVMVTLETDNLLQYQEFTVIDGAHNAGTFPITVNFNDKVCTGPGGDQQMRVIAADAGSETYVWDGMKFHVKG
jgi:hypothetical protein